MLCEGYEEVELAGTLSHLQAIELGSQDDLAELIGYLANTARLNPPARVDYSEAARLLEATWAEPTLSPNQDFNDWIDRAEKRPVKYRDQTRAGIVIIRSYDKIDYQIYRQLGSHLRTRDGIRCLVQSTADFGSWLHYCCAVGDVADLLEESTLPAKFAVSLKCLGEIQLRSDTGIHPFDDPDDALEAEAAFLVEKAERIEMPIEDEE